MSLNFFSLPSEVRNTIYELILLSEEPIDPYVYYHPLQDFTPGLFRANKAVHREACSLLYAQNCFDFTSRTLDDIVSFLTQIGRYNASYIRHIYIDFPKFKSLEAGSITLEDDSDFILATIQSDCPNLQTLKTSLGSTNAMELRLDAQDTPKILGEALKLVDTRFRASSSLQEITVEAYEDAPSDQLRREMRDCGWKISIAENVEGVGSDRSFDDYDYDDFVYHGYEYDDYGYDEYDLDNDSDFWRRAGD